MHIGLSIGECVKDIVQGRVDIGSVAYIISSVYLSNDNPVVIGERYSEPGRVWDIEDNKLCKMVYYELHDNGRILYPRDKFD